MFLGFDRSDYPGDDVLASLRVSDGVSFVAAYLGPAPSHHSASWMPHIADLQAAGWGLVPVYLGQQALGGPGSHQLTAAQAALDAADAAALGDTAGLAPGSVIYLDVEAGGQLAADHLDYVIRWVSAMGPTDYRAGVYCSAHDTAQQIVEATGGLPVWVYRWPTPTARVVDVSAEVAPDPSTSGFDDALVWQYRASGSNASVDLQWTDADGTTQTLVGVDLDTSSLRDPSMPAFPTPQLWSLEPSVSGPGASVTITGRSLSSVNAVGFDGVEAAGLSVVDDTTLIAVVPNGVSGTQVVVSAVSRWNIQATSELQLCVDTAPTVSEIDPTSGPAGSVVRLIGTNLETVTDVGFGAVDCSEIAHDADGAIEVTAPSGADGEEVEVSLVTGGVVIDTGLTFRILATDASRYQPAHTDDIDQPTSDTATVN